MGCINNYIFCNLQSKENNMIIINLDKNHEEKNKEKNDNDNNSKNKNEINNDLKKNKIEIFSNGHLNNKNQINKNIIIYRIDSKFNHTNFHTSKKENCKNNLDINYNRTKESKQYNITNDNCEKLIHFTTFAHNISATTNSILK